MAAQMNSEVSLDAILPPGMASKAEDIGTKKANSQFLNVFLLAVLAGAFIAMGGIFMTVVTVNGINIKDPSGLSVYNLSLPYGITRLFGGIAFSLGLILVIVGGAELFTGNNLLIMAYASKRITIKQLFRNWFIVYIGNFIGSFLTAIIMFFSNQYMMNNGLLGVNILSIGEAKTAIGFVPAIFSGVMCNALVCMAVWLSYSARTTTDKILSIIPPISAFVAAGFEHSVANMYLISIALLIKENAPVKFFELIGKIPTDYPHLSWVNFIWKNLIPVTIGNIIGGSLMVGIIYWFIYLRKQK